MPSIYARLLTPERNLFEGEVTAVFVRTAEGDAAYLPGHTAVIGALVPHLVRFHRASETGEAAASSALGDATELRAAVHGGFVDVRQDAVTVMAPIAELASEIDVERATAAAEAAEARLAELRSENRGPVTPEGHTDLEYVEAEASLARARLRLEVAGSSLPSHETST